MSPFPSGITGLSEQQVLAARKIYGRNAVELKIKSTLITAVLSLVKEPMVILLLLAAGTYFITGKTGDGIFLSVAILLVATISWFQDHRSRSP
jgi:Ca2+-transporting ATPase